MPETKDTSQQRTEGPAQAVVMWGSLCGRDDADRGGHAAVQFQLL